MHCLCAVFFLRLFTSEYGSVLRERYLKEKKRSSITEIVLNCIKMISSHINPS